MPADPKRVVADLLELRALTSEPVEGGVPQRLAFVESWLTIQSDQELALRETVPAKVYSPEGAEAEPEAIRSATASA